MAESSRVFFPFQAAAEVVELVGEQELRVLSRMAAREPYECVLCGRDGTASRESATAVVIQTRAVGKAGAAADQTLFLLRLAHRSCTPSRIIADADITAQVSDHQSVQVSAAVLTPTGAGAHGGRRALLLVDFPSAVSTMPGPDGRSDLLVGSLLEAGMSLVGDIEVEPPPAPGFRVVTDWRTVSIWGPDEALVEDANLVTPPGWKKAAKASGEVTVIAGAGLGADSGPGGLAAASRAGQLAGGVVALDVRRR
jgi:hypothetical protein